MMDTYITLQGDTWDMISHKAYGTSKYTGLLMQNNYQLLDIFIFSSGIEVKIPEIIENNNLGMPIWRDNE